MSTHIAHTLVDPFIGVSVHEAIQPSVPPLPVPAVHLSFGLLSGVMLGAFPTLNHDNGDILGNGDIPFVGRMNASGFFVPHITIPFGFQPLLPLTIIFGDSLVMFGSSSVQVATHNLIFGDSTADMGCCVIPNAPLSLNLGCGDKFPGIDAVVSFGTVEVEMTLDDWITGLIDVAIEVLTTRLFHYIGKRHPFGRLKKKLRFKGADDALASTQHVHKKWKVQRLQPKKLELQTKVVNEQIKAQRLLKRVKRMGITPRSSFADVRRARQLMNAAKKANERGRRALDKLDKLQARIDGHLDDLKDLRASHEAWQRKLDEARREVPDDWITRQTLDVHEHVLRKYKMGLGMRLFGKKGLLDRVVRNPEITNVPGVTRIRHTTAGRHDVWLGKERYDDE